MYFIADRRAINTRKPAAVVADAANSVLIVSAMVKPESMIITTNPRAKPKRP